MASPTPDMSTLLRIWRAATDVPFDRFLRASFSRRTSHRHRYRNDGHGFL
jgi:hypothetical protein